jgi:4-hydroxy-tetrahydrodipicolinate reductase
MPILPLAVSVLGATGKMGKCVLLRALQDPDLRVVAGTASPRSASLGMDLGELAGTKRCEAPLSCNPQAAIHLCDVAIDFSVPGALLAHVQAALCEKKALLIGTTGLLDEEKRAIEKAASEIPIVVSANFSLGIALCLEMASRIGSTLFGAQCTVEISETHHAHKKDRPSGTALALAQAVGREDIAIHSVRSGETVGEHRLVFESGSERIEIAHTAHSRDVFAQGALLAAKQLAHKPAGLYTLKDLFIHG